MLSARYTASEADLSSTLNDVNAEYTERLGRRDVEIATLERRSARMSNVRLLTGGIAIAVAAIVMRGQISAWYLLVPGVAFLMLVIAHARSVHESNGRGNATNQPAIPSTPLLSLRIYIINSHHD